MKAFLTILVIFIITIGSVAINNIDTISEIIFNKHNTKELTNTGKIDYFNTDENTIKKKLIQNINGDDLNQAKMLNDSIKQAENIGNQVTNEFIKNMPTQN